VLPAAKSYLGLTAPTVLVAPSPKEDAETLKGKFVIQKNRVFSTSIICLANKGVV
jgi:hypothetical protein